MNTNEKTGKKKMNGLVIGIIVLVVLVVAVLASRRGVVNSSPMPKYLGVTDGRLARCPESPNCVSTQADASDEGHLIAPISYGGDVAAAREKLATIISAMPRSTVVTNEGNYLHAEFRSLTMGFIDDVEFYIDGEKQIIESRSAARLGYGDGGVNRRRYESIKSAFQNG